MQYNETICGCEEFHKRFLRLEDELDLFDLRIAGIPVWERVRTGVAMELLADLGLTGRVHTGHESIRARARGLYLVLRNGVYRNPFLSRSSDLLFMGHPRRVKLSDSWWDIYCDPIHERSDFDYVQVEEDWQFEHFRPAETENLRYLDVIKLFSRLLVNLGLTRHQFTPSEERAIERIESGFSFEFGSGASIEDRIRFHINTHSVEKRLYDRLLSLVDPELVVSVSYSGRETFIEACHDAGAPVAELQHGQISPYSYQHSFPGHRTKQAYPDYLLTFGEFWNEAAEFPIPDDRIISVGYPYLEREIEKYADVKRNDRIVFISTAEVGPDLSEFAVELSQHPDVSMQVTYKLHPDEYDSWRADYPHLTDAPVEVVGADGPSLYETFARATAQVGVSSTAVYEGLAFELDTYLVRMPTIEWLSPLIDNGEAKVVGSADELATHLATTTKRSIPCENYFKPNAAENAIKTIEELMREGTMVGTRKSGSTSD